ncbi:hypothetical protein MSPP1_003348 [Malassezia sp. CBS 17886]|nr:hypothetical protein MSPP1_003348 [Malassezia sp. CBS 17886]
MSSPPSDNPPALNPPLLGSSNAWLPKDLVETCGLQGALSDDFSSGPSAFWPFTLEPPWMGLENGVRDPVAPKEPPCFTLPSAMDAPFLDDSLARAFRAGSSDTSSDSHEDDDVLPALGARSDRARMLLGSPFHSPPTPSARDTSLDGLDDISIAQRWFATPDDRMSAAWYCDNFRPASEPLAGDRTHHARVHHPMHLRSPPAPTPRNTARMMPRDVYCTSDAPLWSVFVGGLEPMVSEDDLVRHFASPPQMQPEQGYMPLQSPFANQSLRVRHVVPFAVHSAKIVRPAVSTANRGYGFVRFLSREESERALAEMHHSLLIPQQMPWKTVRVYISTANRQCNRFMMQCSPRGGDKGSPETPGALGAPRACSRMAASAPRTRRRATVPMRGAIGRGMSPRGSSKTDAAAHDGVPTTIMFVDTEEAEGEQNTRPDLASALTVAHSTSALDPTNTTVFVGSLFSIATESLLFELFSPFGPIVSVNVPRGHDYGFVQFCRKDDAAQAIASMQRYEVAGGNLRLSWGRNVGEKAVARAAVRAGLRWVEDAV